jgi:hypothetical protein
MLSLLLRKALPFALTFVVGTALGGLTWLSGGAGKKAETALYTRTYDFHGGCSKRRHRLVAETKPLEIHFKPDARWPRGIMMARPGGRPDSARVRVTFGADGRVAEVSPADAWLAGEPARRSVLAGVWYAVEGTARQIRFTPETVDSVPVTVTKDVEIRFLTD